MQAVTETMVVIAMTVEEASRLAAQLNSMVITDSLELADLREELCAQVD